MDTRGSKKIVAESPFFASGQSMLHIVPHAGHGIAYEKPETWAQLLIDDLLQKISHVYQPKKTNVTYLDSDGNIQENPDDLI